MDRWKVRPDYPLRRLNCPLQSVAVLFSGRSKQDIVRSAEDRLENESVEGDQQLLWQAKLLELSQKVQFLLSFLAEIVHVRCPLQFPRDCGSKELGGNTFKCPRCGANLDIKKNAVWMHVPNCRSHEKLQYGQKKHIPHCLKYPFEICFSLKAL